MDSAKNLEKRRRELEKKVAEVEAQKKVNTAELKKIEKEIKEKTGLTDLTKLDVYLETLEKEINVKRNTLAESVSKLESELVEIFNVDSNVGQSKSLAEDINDI